MNVQRTIHVDLHSLKGDSVICQPEYYYHHVLVQQFTHQLCGRDLGNVESCEDYCRFEQAVQQK